jgi:hypothetical protein
MFVDIVVLFNCFKVILRNSMKFEIKGSLYVENSTWNIVAKNNINVGTVILLSGGVINAKNVNISNSGENDLLNNFEFLKCEDGGRILEVDEIRVLEVKCNGKSLFSLSSGESTVRNSVFFLSIDIIIYFSILMLKVFMVQEV